MRRADANRRREETPPKDIVTTDKLQQTSTIRSVFNLHLNFPTPAYIILKSRLEGLILVYISLQHTMPFQKSRLGLGLIDRVVKDSNVVWITPRPSGQDIYNPGSTILAAWTSAQTINSPAFQLCVVSTSASEIGDCSPTVWPEVTETEGVYQVPVTVPDALWDGTFFLRMLDNSGDAMSSPTFSLHPAGDSAETVADGEPQAQAPLGPIASVTPSRLYSNSVATSSSTPPSLPSPFSPVSSVSIANVLAAKTTPPTAYALPLSAMAAIILVAGVFYLKQRRKRGTLPSRTSSGKSSSSGRREAGHALRVLSRRYGSPRSQTPKPRQRTLDAFPLPAYAQWGPPPSPQDPPQSSVPVERPRLPPIATTTSFMSARTDSANHAILSGYSLPLAASHVIDLDTALPAPCPTAAALPRLQPAAVRCQRRRQRALRPRRE
ncbi:Cupin-5 domain-containing protein [Mycena sanguinolenta]|uniref:Cupin-5 domain-containing protein n=1 Tax=Mycena sanguinolenta TaxID=230812 RepID=A0A8H6XZS9_9AGAR|nr:Cupin-5 domain-containing protein [Mycena sanguinolenta]